MNNPRILIFIPTFNERGNVERMAKELSALGLDADILFLDDNSPDGTGQLLDQLASEVPRLSVVHRPGKQGIGSAHQVGIGIAYDRGYDVLVTLDCDFSHDPKDIPRLLQALQGHDVVVGSRYLESDSLPGWNFIRRFLTMFGHFLTVRLLGLHHDASGAFRAYNLRRINREIFALVTSQSYPFFFESLFLLVRNGLSINEIPIVLPARIFGSSKLTVYEAFCGGTYLLRLWLENLAHPERFLRIRPVDAVLSDPPTTDWDAYWGKKQTAGALVYEVVAAFYRKLFIKPNLERALRQNFHKGAKLLHAGCGSGQVDVDLHKLFSVMAVDISMEALALYGRNNPKARRIEQADIFSLPFEADSLDGVFNLGVMEHFDENQIQALLKEFHRVIKPRGKVVLFWPHARATSVYFLNALRWVLQTVLRKNVALHPEEISLMSGKSMAQSLFDRANLKLNQYHFGPSDFFVQVLIVGQKS